MINGTLNERTIISHNNVLFYYSKKILMSKSLQSFVKVKLVDPSAEINLRHELNIKKNYMVLFSQCLWKKSNVSEKLS